MSVLRLFGKACLGTLACLVVQGTVHAAQPYPARELRLVVPFATGGAVDTLARAVGQKLAESLGRPVIIDNRAGAAGAIGSEAVARAPADGYTLLMGSTTTISINPSLKLDLPYSPTRDFAPISLVAFVPHVLVVNPEVPADSIQDFISYAKSRPVPMGFASAGAGSPHHLAGEIFKSMTGVEMLHVPYKGTGPGLVDLMSGQVQFMSVEMVAALPQVRAGKVKALGVATGVRSEVAPELRTVAEAGLPGFEITSWYGLFAPAGTPPDIVALLAEHVDRALHTPQLRASLEKMGATPGGGTPKDFAAHIARENAKWAKAVAEAGVKIE
jgi:Uncharacterized protein conserved in bacteria